MVEILPYVPIATTLRFGVAIFSYCGQVTFGITGDRDHTADIDVLARGVEDSLAELIAAAERTAAATTAEPADVVTANGSTSTSSCPLGAGASGTAVTVPCRTSATRRVSHCTRPAITYTG